MPSKASLMLRSAPRVRAEFTLGPRRARTRGRGPRTGSGRVSKHAPRRWSAVFAASATFLTASSAGVPRCLVVRGRDADFAAPPAQIPASPIRALGSCLGCLTANRTLGQGCRTRGLGRNGSASSAIGARTSEPALPGACLHRMRRRFAPRRSEPTGKSRVVGPSRPSFWLLSRNPRFPSKEKKAYFGGESPGVTRCQ